MTDQTRTIDPDVDIWLDHVGAAMNAVEAAYRRGDGQLAADWRAVLRKLRVNTDEVNDQEARDVSGIVVDNPEWPTRPTLLARLWNALLRFFGFRP